jgi:hypothetical protein
MCCLFSSGSLVGTKDVHQFAICNPHQSRMPWRRTWVDKTQGSDHPKEDRRRCRALEVRRGCALSGSAE